MLLIGGLALGLVATGVKATDGTHAAWDTALTASGGGLFLVAGTTAALRRHDNGTGRLMMATGIALFAEDLQLAPLPWLHLLGLALSSASTGVFAHLLLAFPSGRLHRPLDRVVVASAYAWSGLAVPLAALLPRLGPPVTVPDPLAGGAPITLAEVVGRLGFGLALATLLRLLQHWRSTRPLLRGVLTPVLVTNLLVVASAVGAALAWSSDSPAYRPLVVTGQVGTALLPLLFLAGLLRVRLGRSRVSRLMEAMARPLTPEQLRHELRDALLDPALVVGYRRATGGDLVDLHGAPVPAADEQHVLTPVVHDGRTVGALRHAEALVVDEHVLRAAVAGAGIAMENQRLNAELRAQLAEVRSSRSRIVAAEQRERTRIERDLHDGVQASLVAALIWVRQAPPDPALARAAVGLEQGLADLRRILHGIRPAVLAEAGLEAAIRVLLDGAGVATTLRLRAPLLEPPVADTLYYVAAEAVTNAVRHGSASRIDVELVQLPLPHRSRHSSRLRLIVRDNGIGGAAARPDGGIEGLQDRLRAVGGALHVFSPPGGGTTVRAEIDGNWA